MSGPKRGSPSELEVPFALKAGPVSISVSTSMDGSSEELTQLPSPPSHPAPGCQGAEVTAGMIRMEVGSASPFLLPQKSSSLKPGSSGRPSVSPCGGSPSLTRNMKMTHRTSEKGNGVIVPSIMYLASDGFQNSTFLPTLLLSWSTIPGAF